MMNKKTTFSVILLLGLFSLFFVSTTHSEDVVEEIEQVVVVEKVSVEIPQGHGGKGQGEGHGKGHEGEGHGDVEGHGKEQVEGHGHGNDIPKGPTVVDSVLEKGHEYFNKGAEYAREVVKLPQRLLERKNELEELLVTISHQNPVLLMVLALIPILAYVVLIPEKFPVKNYSEKISVEEYNSQTLDFTAQQVAELQSFIAANPNIVETTKYFKEIYTTDSSNSTTTETR